MGLVTTFWPLTTTGDGRFVLQTAPEPRFKVDARLKPRTFVGHDRTAFVPYDLDIQRQSR